MVVENLGGIMLQKERLLYSAGLVAVFLFSLIGAVGCGNSTTVYVCPNGTQQDTPCTVTPTNTPNTATTPTSPPSGNTPTSPSGVTGLTPQEVQTWCSVIGTGTCDISRFEQLVEANGAVNPNGVHMKTGDPVEIHIPAGYRADVWDCFKLSSATGATDLKQVCEMSVRRV